jgi:hypothetical protein
MRVHPGGLHSVRACLLARCRSIRPGILPHAPLRIAADATSLVHRALRIGSGRLALPAAVLSASLVASVAWGAASAADAAGAVTAEPSANVPPIPNYTKVCAATLDTSSLCLRLTLGAIDRARQAEHLGPMQLPGSFVQMSVPQQVLVAVNLERVDRGLPPFVGMPVSLLAAAQSAASRGEDPSPVAGFDHQKANWIGDPNNGLDVDYQWMYNDGPGSGLPRCTAAGGSGCWVDRRIVLGSYGGGTQGTPVMAAALDPGGDTAADDRGGPSLAVVFASSPSTGASASEPLSITWVQLNQGVASLAPLAKIPKNESSSGIPNPVHNVAADPDYANACATSGTDSSARCIQATLAAIDHARSLEGVGPMVLPANYGQLGIAEQLFVAINLERVDRGLTPFVGMTTALDANAQKGANTANDPPDAGSAYVQTDGEWSGGNSNGLDAVYGWMYDDGFNSGNLDCPKTTSPGCWGHRTGILDDFGSDGVLVMGCAFNPTGDNNKGDVRGPSMASTLALTYQKPTSFVYTWAQALAAMPGAGGAS